jgi:DNA-binding transcriptional LysR family regulator
MSRNTLEGIEALCALAQFGTVSEAATRLRLTQSAVTKRLQALQNTVDRPLVKHAGRRLELTAEAHVLLERARPLLADLRALTEISRAPGATSFSLAIADSIAASWGPRVLAAAIQSIGSVRVDLHVHRSVLLIENVRLGRYQIGLATDVPAQKDLIHYPVIAEPMVLIGARSPGRVSARPLITIEPTSLTWRAIEPLIRTHRPELLTRTRLPVESFSAAIQMVKAGFGDGLVPLGLAREMKVPARGMHVLKNIDRHVTLLTRKTVNQSNEFTSLRIAIEREAKRHLARDQRST